MKNQAIYLDSRSNYLYFKFILTAVGLARSITSDNHTVK